MDGLPISAGRTFETIEEVEEAVKLLESNYILPSIQTVQFAVSERIQQMETESW